MLDAFPCEYMSSTYIVVVPGTWQQLVFDMFRWVPVLLLLLQADNVGSSQMAKIRFALRGTATVLMGKNTMIRKIISTYLKDHPDHPFELVRCNIGNMESEFQMYRLPGIYLVMP